MTKRDGTVALSKRLKTIADMLPGGGRLADVGCDHGFLDIYLVQNGKYEGALAMDVRKGPLAAATQHVREVGLEDRIRTRLSDGLEAFQVGEANALVCAGMGGPLMQRILTAYPEKTESFQDFLLQPQSEIKEFRAFLRENGYRITEERIVLEDGKYYFPMLVRRGGGDPAPEEMTEVWDRYGEGLLKSSDPLMKQYLNEQKRVLESVLAQIGDGEGQSERKESRKAEMKYELEILQRAMDLME